MALKTDTYLRRAERDDLDTVVQWMDDPDFQYFLYGDPARSPRQVREQIVNALGRTLNFTMPGSIYFIIESAAHGPVGLVALQSLSWRNRSCTVDLYMGRKDLRASFTAGIATYRAIEYCFNELNLHRVGAYIYSFNTPSWRLMELSGATREVTLRKHVARDGELHDVYCYGLLRHEFKTFGEKLGTRFEGRSLAAMIEQITATNEEPDA
jgi:RimJ/RimL family protein N-acetyltransferase